MMSESNRMFVAGGLLIGALVLMALWFRFGNRESSANEADGRFDSALSSAARPVAPDAPGDDARNAGIERVLQAVHDSLQRGDLVSARVLLDAVLTMRANEPQALLLQQELAAREERAKTRETRTAALDEQNMAKPRMRTHVAANTTYAGSEKPHRLTEDPDQDEAAPDNAPPIAIRPDDVKNDDGPADHPDNPVLPRPNAQPEATAASTVQVAATAAEPVEPAAPPTAQSSAPAGTPPAATGAAPKTRAEVRDELSRARQNGTMSRFGNPDPYGPGGSPSYNAQPAIRTW